MSKTKESDVAVVERARQRLASRQILRWGMLLLTLIACAATGGCAADNIAPEARVPVSSPRDGSPKVNAIDGTMQTRMNAPVIAVAGDLLGHLIGTVSRTDGTVAVKDAFIEVTGQTPAGPWKSAAKTDEQGFLSGQPVKPARRAGGGGQVPASSSRCAGGLIREWKTGRAL